MEGIGGKRGEEEEEKEEGGEEEEERRGRGRVEGERREERKGRGREVKCAKGERRIIFEGKLLALFGHYKVVHT